MASVKNRQNAKICISVSKAGKPLHGSQQPAFQQGLRKRGALGLVRVSAVAGAGAQREIDKERELACICLSLPQGALMLWSPFNLPPQIIQGSGLASCVCTELLRPPVSTSCSVSSRALQSAMAPQRGLGTDGLISADKGSASKGEARRKPSGLISLSGAVNGRLRRQAGAGWRLAPLQGAQRGNKFSLKSVLLVPPNGICLPLFQAAPAKPSLPPYVRYDPVFAEPAALHGR